MNYKQIYNQLISKRQQETPPENCYTETHHIKPKCLGGTNEQTNLVKLTAREHYIAHLLLAKIYNTYGMYAAVIYMQTGRHKNRHFKFNSRLYQKIREEFANKMSQKMKGKILTEQHKQKLSIAHKGKPLTEEHKQKLSVSNKGKPRSEETRKKISEAKKNMSEETKQKIAESLKGKHHSDETKQKMSDAFKALYWFNNGIIAVRAKSCPEGFVRGRYLQEESRKKMAGSHKGRCWWNNGIKNVFSRECPEGFVRGILTKKKAQRT